MISVSSVIGLQDDAVTRWHREPIAIHQIDAEAIVLANHEINFRLWHEEDQARDPKATDSSIATVKRSIDRLNQLRADSIERLDDAIDQWILNQTIAVSSDLLNTETPGSAIDRLSILSLRIFHLDEENHRARIADATRQRVTLSLRVAKQQRTNLATSLQQLLNDLATGSKRHQTFRQLKMYNDPELNPVLYQKR